MIPTVATLYFGGFIKAPLNNAQVSILAILGLQHKQLDDAAAGVGLAANQVLALFNRSVAKISKFFWEIETGTVKDGLTEVTDDADMDMAIQPALQPALQPADVNAIEEESVTPVPDRDAEKDDVEIERNDDLESLQKQLLTSRPEIMATMAVKGDEKDWKDVKVKSQSATVSIGHVKPKETEEPAVKHKIKKHKHHHKH